jgi:hypothetical protein
MPVLDGCGTSMSRERYLLADVLDQLHCRVSKRPLPQMCEPSDSSTLQEIANCTGAEVSIVVDRALQRYLRSKNVSIQAFRASVVYPLAEDDFSWPVLEWTEGDGTKVLAIFEVDADTEPPVCNWLMHQGIQGGRTDDSRWMNASVMWRVTEIDCLRPLFGAARHLLGILDWTSADAHNLYCRGTLESCSDEKYVTFRIRI